MGVEELGGGDADGFEGGEFWEGDDVEDCAQDADSHGAAGGSEELDAAGDDSAALPAYGVLSGEEKAHGAGSESEAGHGENAGEHLLECAVGGADEEAAEADGDEDRAEDCDVAESPANDQGGGDDSGEGP